MKWQFPPTGWSQAPLIIDQNSLERMDRGGPREIDAFLLREIKWMKREYMRTGNPRIIYMIGTALADKVMPIRGSLYSFQFSQLQALLAEMIIAQGKDITSLRMALYHLEFAFETVQRVQALDDGIIRAQVSYALLHSVAQKAVGDFDSSINDIKLISRYLTTKKSATELDLIPLQRQEIMMRQTAAGHRQLAESAVRYATLRPKEYYRSLKRVFEFLLNKGRIQEAELIYPAFKRSFAAVKQQVAPISRVSFIKNIGQYFMAQGEIREAARIFNSAYIEASQRSLKGQMRQVKLLVQELEGGSRVGKLVTFKAEDIE